MNEKEAQKVLDELQGVRPEKLTGEAKRLFKAIMVIADGRDRAYKIIDLMAEQLAGLAIFDIDKDEPLILGDKEEIKQYFKEKVEDGTSI